MHLDAKFWFTFVFFYSNLYIYFYFAVTTSTFFNYHFLCTKIWLEYFQRFDTNTFSGILGELAKSSTEYYNNIIWIYTFSKIFQHIRMKWVAVIHINLCMKRYEFYFSSISFVVQLSPKVYFETLKMILISINLYEPLKYYVSICI